jgi:hypothetical protein
MTIDHM